MVEVCQEHFVVPLGSLALLNLLTVAVVIEIHCSRLLGHRKYVASKATIKEASVVMRSLNNISLLCFLFAFYSPFTWQALNKLSASHQFSLDALSVYMA